MRVADCEPNQSIYELESNKKKPWIIFGNIFESRKKNQLVELVRNADALHEANE